MDWFFNGINDFFQFAFRGMESLITASESNLMNLFLIAFTSGITIWWMIQMLKHPKEDS